MKRKLALFNGLTSAASSFIAILVGLAAGFLILVISNPQNAVAGLSIILSGGFNEGMKGLGKVLYFATPIIVTGLSVGFAFKTGLFNIGATGQLMVGGFVAVVVGVRGDIFGPVQWLVALIAGMLAGAVWGMIPGLFKALLNVHEVISSIMMNYIGMYGINYLIKNMSYMVDGKKMMLVYNSAKSETFSVDASAVIPSWGLDNVFYRLTKEGNKDMFTSLNGGIIIAIVLAIVIYLLLNRTTFGYELKACGYNRNASRYAGISEKRSIVMSMVIAGALAGVAGALMYLAPAEGLHIEVKEVLAAQGFTGIPVALLALSNPLAIIFSGIFVAYITVGGANLTILKYMEEIISIIVGIIIYFSAFSLLIKQLLARGTSKRRHREEEKEPEAAKNVGKEV